MRVRTLCILAAVSCALLASCATTRPQWKADLKCNARGEVPAFTLPLTVRTNERQEFILEHGAPGQPEYVRLRGFPDPDDKLELTGEIAPPRGKPDKARLEGRRDGRGYSVSGRAGGQNCTIAVRLE